VLAEENLPSTEAKPAYSTQEKRKPESGGEKKEKRGYQLMPSSDNLAGRV